MHGYIKKKPFKYYREELMGKDLTKAELYESVKTIIETDQNIIHLNQHKLYTLFSIAFQFILFNSTKDPGHYIIRIEDGALAEKLAKRSKDPTTRKFFTSLMIPSKMKFQNSWFYLDSFNVNSWNITKSIPAEKLKGAIIVHDPHPKPLTDEMDEFQQTLGENFHLTGLSDTKAKIILI